MLWHHGSPQTGALLEPVAAAAAARGFRLFSYGRPSYGGSSARPGRTVASAAEDSAAVADALGINDFAVMGASGGGPHALACAALLPGRVWGAVVVAGIAPHTDDFPWYAGMASPEALQSAARGRDARAAYQEVAQFDETSFVDDDWAALEGAWSSLGDDVGRAAAYGMDGLIDDDVAFAQPWGFELDQVQAPVLLVQGGRDRVVPAAHAEWQLAKLPNAELWLRPRAGHVSILDAVPLAMDWLRERHR